jgi:membrane-bound lytic murein transglycosylase F
VGPTLGISLIFRILSFLNVHQESLGTPDGAVSSTKPQSMTFLKQGLMLAGACLIPAALLIHALRPDPTESGITVTEPVSVDLDRILERGSIRVISRYNSMTYFVQNGVERGFEFEWASAFAHEHGLRVEMVLPNEHEHPIDLLNRGDGDLIAANYASTPERARWITFTEPYNLVREHLVIHQDMASHVGSVDQLAGMTVHVRRNSSYFASLLRLQEQGVSIQIETVPEGTETETLLAWVESGEIAATVADDNLIATAAMYLPHITAGPVVADVRPVAWGLRNNAPALKAAMDTFIVRHIRSNEQTGEYRRSELLNVLRQRYYDNPRAVLHNRWQVRQKRQGGLLSPFDALVRPIADEAGLDWKLVVAVIAQESRFDPVAVSHKGAVGLMQVVPRYSAVDSDTLLFDAETNIREGVRILRENLRHFAHLDSLNRLQFALAAYNAGIGHVADARRLTIDRNRNPNEWDHVQESFLLLMNREYHQHARFGYVRGTETVHYVNSVMSRYRTYDLFRFRAAYKP